MPVPDGNPEPAADEVGEGDNPEVAEPRRYAGFRRNLRKFAESGDVANARTALGHWARKATGGGTAAGGQAARAARSGGALLDGLARAAVGQAPEAGAIDIRTLDGQPLESAISAIVDAFMPPGILDEVAARLAMEQALASAMDGEATFELAKVNDDLLRVATLSFVTELVFTHVAGDAGRSLAAAGPLAAAQRERDIRSLVRVVVDLAGAAVLAAARAVQGRQSMATVVSRLIRESVEIIETW